MGDRLPSRSPRPVQDSGLDAVRGDLAVFARSYAIRRNRAAWLLGAGASAMSGIQTAAALTFQFKVELYCSAHGLAVQEFDSSDPAVRARVEAYFDGRNGMPPRATLASTRLRSPLRTRLRPCGLTSSPSWSLPPDPVSGTTRWRRSWPWI